MAKERKPIPRNTKRNLLKEAGNKCANPGCPNRRTHIHHIRKWAVYQTHDQEHMIAICPSCHDAVNDGSLIIDDATIYAWKKIKRETSNNDHIYNDHIYIEPNTPTKLLLGTISVTGDAGAIVFDLSQNNRLDFKLLEDFAFLNVRLSTLEGKEILQVVNNHLKFSSHPQVVYERRPGRIRITSTATTEFIPAQAISIMRVSEPTFASDGRVTLLDLEVLEPGLVRVQGVWAESNHAVIITLNSLSFIQPEMLRPFSLIGSGAESTLKWTGPITNAMFGFRKT